MLSRQEVALLVKDWEVWLSWRKYVTGCGGGALRFQKPMIVQAQSPPPLSLPTPFLPISIYLSASRSGCRILSSFSSTVSTCLPPCSLGGSYQLHTS